MKTLQCKSQDTIPKKILGAECTQQTALVYQYPGMWRNRKNRFSRRQSPSFFCHEKSLDTLIFQPYYIIPADPIP